MSSLQKNRKMNDKRDKQVLYFQNQDMSVDSLSVEFTLQGYTMEEYR